MFCVAPDDFYDRVGVTKIWLGEHIRLFTILRKQTQCKQTCLEERTALDAFVNQCVDLVTICRPLWGRETCGILPLSITPACCPAPQVRK